MAFYTYDYDRSYTPAAPVVELEISSPTFAETVTLSALIDSGADATVLPKDLLMRIKAQRIDTRMLRTVTGARIPVSLFRVTLRIGPYILPNIHAVGNASSQEAIMGRDALNQLIVTMNGLAATTEISR